LLLEHDPEKWVPVFRKDHAPSKIYSAMTIQLKTIALQAVPLHAPRRPFQRSGPDRLSSLSARNTLL
jgi:hypothetical protein